MEIVGLVRDGPQEVINMIFFFFFFFFLGGGGGGAYVKPIGFSKLKKK